MKAGFYPKLALDGIRKNKQMYLPYILTCIGMVMMYYIIAFLQYSKSISYLRGADEIRWMFDFGGWVIAIFSCIFLFYTNSFLIRRRKKEFGLYNILGMGKRNIGRIIYWETLIIALFSLGIGLIAGVSLSKLAELGLVNIMMGDVSYTLSVSLTSVIKTTAVFGVIFVLLFLNSLRQVRFSSAINLLRSENKGEKPPKGNWLWGILGVLILAAAYYLAMTIKNPIAALEVFFIAVIMVIVGTYLVMISGSVLFCRILQKKKNYYYKSNHFVSVSSMVYRMKRNGAGLASICVLATMVLVMISSTTSMYFGSEDAINSRYPRDINMEYYMENADDLSDEKIAALQSDISEVLEKYDVEPENYYNYRCVSVAGLIKGNSVETDVSKANAITDMSGVRQFYFVPLSDYNAMMGTNETLGSEEVLIYTYRNDYKADTISFKQGNTFKIKKQLDELVEIGDTAMMVVPSMTIIVPDLKQSLKGLDTLLDYNGDKMLSYRWVYDFDTGIEADKQIELCREFEKANLDSYLKFENISLYCESQEMEREDLYSMYGGFFYLGIMLSIVFIFAAVLIIYYKQISEGYEDQARFEIMQKVGMTKREIKKSINSQLLTVFFLPIVLSALHLVFAFPIIRKLLLLFSLNNVILFAVTTVISVIIFALFYTLIYRITSNAYYNLVSGENERS